MEKEDKSPQYFAPEASKLDKEKVVWYRDQRRFESLEKQVGSQEAVTLQGLSNYVLLHLRRCLSRWGSLPSVQPGLAGQERKGQSPNLGPTDQHLTVFCFWISDHCRQIMEGEIAPSPRPCPGGEQS